MYDGLNFSWILKSDNCYETVKKKIKNKKQSKSYILLAYLGGANTNIKVINKLLSVFHDFTIIKAQRKVILMWWLTNSK